MTSSRYAKLDPKWGEFSPFHDPYILANFKPRQSDVLITTAPKAGTTWMQQILYQLLTGGDTAYTSIFQVIPWLEAPDNKIDADARLKGFESMVNPRVFKTHCTYPQTPGADTVRIVLSSRDPRDCCVSFYHHIMSMTDKARARYAIEAPASFDDYFEEWMNFSSWYRNIESWWPHINDDNVLWLRYEDMVRDLDLCVDRLLEFLVWRLSDEQRKTAIEHSTFSWMKANRDKFVPRDENGEPEFIPGGFIRKGEVGDHKKLLSPEQERAIIDRAYASLPDSCITFLGLG